MVALCTFCKAALPAAPPGASVRCPSCGNLTSTPDLPATELAMPGYAPPPPASGGLPFARVDQPKPAASPPPAVVLPSRAGGVDELVGGGLTLLGIGALKFFAIAFVVLSLGCVLSMVGLAFR